MQQIFINNTCGELMEIQTPCASGCSQVKFDDLSQVLGADRAPLVLWCPKNRNYPAVDALYLGSTADQALLIQCTVSDKGREYDGPRTQEVLERLGELWFNRYGGDQRVRLVYLVPPDTFALGRFKYPKLGDNVPSSDWCRNLLDVYIAQLRVEYE